MGSMVKFDKHIPPPKEDLKVDMAPFMAADIGDSWTIEGFLPCSVYGCIGVMARRYGKRFKTVQEKGGQWDAEGCVMRVWRIA